MGLMIDIASVMTIGQRIRKVRRTRDLTQAELGEKAGIDPRNLTRYENDKLKPSLKVLMRLADALDTPIEQFIDGEESGKPNRLQTFQDKELLKLFLAAEQMEPDDKAAVKKVLQAMTLKSQIQGLTKTA
jgi:transcriptional regulator with XRE-family HTH domain